MISGVPENRIIAFPTSHTVAARHRPVSAPVVAPATPAETDEPGIREGLLAQAKLRQALRAYQQLDQSGVLREVQ